MTQSAPNGYTTCDFCVSFSLYCIFCHKMEALAQMNTKITRYSYPNLIRDISIMPTWAEEAQQSIWDWQMYVLVYLRPLSQGSLQNSYSPTSSACSCLSQLCQEKVGLVQRLVKAAHLVVAGCRVQDKFLSLSSVVSKQQTLKGCGRE